MYIVHTWVWLEYVYATRRRNSQTTRSRDAAAAMGLYYAYGKLIEEKLARSMKRMLEEQRVRVVGNKFQLLRKEK